MPLSVASVGECMLELSASGGDQWRMGFAGDTFNTMWTMRALLAPDARADYVSAFGDDPFSLSQKAFLTEHNIGTADSPTIAGARPGLYAITLDGHERSFTYWRADAAARQLAVDPEALHRSLEGRTLIYFSGITLAILAPAARGALLSALERARGRGALVAFDPNYRPRLWLSPDAARQAIASAHAAVDIVLPTFEDEQILFGDTSPSSSAARLQQSGVGEIVVKDGPAPALVAWRGRSEIIDAVALARPVDTTGAGDAFNGAYLVARGAGDEPPVAVARAHRVAAAVVEVRGALAPFETLRRAFAESRPA